MLRCFTRLAEGGCLDQWLWDAANFHRGHGAVRQARVQLAPQACALRLSSAGHRARPLGHVGERATQRLEAERALVLVSRSCRGGARALPRPSELLASWRARLERILAVARAPATNQEDATNHAARVHGRRRLHRSPAGGVAACEQLPFSRERSWRRRASEAGARAATAREAYPSTRVVGAVRAGPIRSASDAVGERPGLE